MVSEWWDQRKSGWTCSELSLETGSFSNGFSATGVFISCCLYGRWYFIPQENNRCFSWDWNDLQPLDHLWDWQFIGSGGWEWETERGGGRVSVTSLWPLLWNSCPSYYHQFLFFCFFCVRKYPCFCGQVLIKIFSLFCIHLRIFFFFSIVENFWLLFVLPYNCLLLFLCLSFLVCVWAAKRNRERAVWGPCSSREDEEVPATWAWLSEGQTEAGALPVQ